MLYKYYLIKHFCSPTQPVHTFISSAGLVRVCGAYLLGICRTNDVCSSQQLVRSDFTHFRLGDRHQTFRIYQWHGLVDARPFFGQKIFGVKGHGPKRGKTVKIYLLLQFLSQDVHLFRMCCPPQGQKNVGNGILIQGPKILQKIFENGQNFELFCCLSQNLKNFGLDRFWGPDFVSVENFWFGAPVWPLGPPKGQNFKIFVFERRTFKI